MEVQVITRHYKISDVWLDAFSNDESRYCDIDEIRKNPAGSQYIIDLIALGVITENDIQKHKQRASFIDAGFSIGLPGADEDHDYLSVNGIMKEENWKDVLQLYPAYPYNYIYRRIYAHRTTARNISFQGFANKAYDETDNSVINDYGIPK